MTKHNNEYFLLLIISWSQKSPVSISANWYYVQIIELNSKTLIFLIRTKFALNDSSFLHLEPYPMLSLASICLPVRIWIVIGQILRSIIILSHKTATPGRILHATELNNQCLSTHTLLVHTIFHRFIATNNF